MSLPHSFPLVNSNHNGFRGHSPRGTLCRADMLWFYKYLIRAFFICVALHVSCFSKAVSIENKTTSSTSFPCQNCLETTAGQMQFLSWCSRRVGGLSLIALLILCYWVLSGEVKASTPYAPSSGSHVAVWDEDSEETRRDAGHLTVLFAYYSLLIHILVVIFPIRACWAIWDVTRSLRKMTRVKKWKESKSQRLSSSSISSADTLTATQTSSSSSEAGDAESGYFADAEVEQHQDIHAILIPNYKEGIDMLRETLDVLACHPQARAQYDVSLRYSSTNGSNWT